MGNNRGRGEIKEKGKGKWLVRIFRGRDANGRRQYFSKVISGKKAAAQKYLTGKLREADLGAFVESSKLTLNEHLDSWLALIEARVADQTHDSYESVLKTHIRPELAQRRLSEIRIDNIQAVYSRMRDAGLSPRTIRYAHAVLSMAMKKAVELNLIVRNPCQFAELPKQIRDETKAMSPAETAAFLKAASDVGHGIIFEFAVETGMRPEEYLAVKWSDVDFQRRTAVVQRALVWKKGGGFKFSEPKTKKSRRTIPFSQSLGTKLAAHRKDQLQQRLRLGSAYENLDLVFAGTLGKPIHYRNLTQRFYERALEHAGLGEKGFVLYSLRHTCATLLLAAGENPKVVAERLGHSSVKTTLDTYSHVLPDMQRSATDKLAAILAAGG